ncbi:unnamed protein product [Musa banksii]
MCLWYSFLNSFKEVGNLNYTAFFPWKRFFPSESQCSSHKLMWDLFDAKLHSHVPCFIVIICTPRKYIFILYRRKISNGAHKTPVKVPQHANFFKFSVNALQLF